MFPRQMYRKPAPAQHSPKEQLNISSSQTKRHIWRHSSFLLCPIYAAFHFLNQPHQICPITAPVPSSLISHSHDPLNTSIFFSFPPRKALTQTHQASTFAFFFATISTAFSKYCLRNNVTTKPTWVPAAGNREKRPRQPAKACKKGERRLHHQAPPPTPPLLAPHQRQGQGVRGRPVHSHRARVHGYFARLHRPRDPQVRGSRWTIDPRSHSCPESTLSRSRRQRHQARHPRTVCKTK